LEVKEIIYQAVPYVGIARAFGDVIDAMHASSSDNQLHIQQYLGANCFGDFHTRAGLNIRTRLDLDLDLARIKRPRPAVLSIRCGRSHRPDR
jgi:hypothetical protein